MSSKLTIVWNYILPSEGSPSWVQTTVASAASHKSSQTVPHLPSKQISTLPNVPFVPLASLTSVSLHMPEKVKLKSPLLQQKWDRVVKLCSKFTLTGDSSIFRMATVMIANSIARAVHQVTFSARAKHIIKPDRASSLTKGGIRVNNCTCKWSNYNDK